MKCEINEVYKRLWMEKKNKKNSSYQIVNWNLKNTNFFFIRRFKDKKLKFIDEDWWIKNQHLHLKLHTSVKLQFVKKNPISREEKFEYKKKTEKQVENFSHFTVHREKIKKKVFNFIIWISFKIYKKKPFCIYSTPLSFIYSPHNHTILGYIFSHFSSEKELKLNSENEMEMRSKNRRKESWGWKTSEMKMQLNSNSAFNQSQKMKLKIVSIYT